MLDQLSNEGDQSAIARIGGQVAPKFEMKFGAASGLHEFGDQYQFFSPALLYIFGRFDDGPLLQFMAEKAPDLRIMFHRFARRLFKGMVTPDGDENWNYALWAMESSIWPVFENYLLSFAITDSEHQCVFKVGAQDLTIADPLTVDRRVVLPPALPSIDVVVLGVDSNKYAVAMKAQDDLMQHPEVEFHPPQPPTVDFANALFKGQQL
jgi:hypothetical protein